VGVVVFGGTPLMLGGRVSQLGDRTACPFYNPEAASNNNRPDIHSTQFRGVAKMGDAEAVSR
jgi:hypothetical protein